MLYLKCMKPEDNGLQIYFWCILTARINISEYSFTQYTYLFHLAVPINSLNSKHKQVVKHI